MARKKLTDRAVRHLNPRNVRYEVWDASTAGFGVRVSPAGRKTFQYLYRYEGLPRRMSLGVYPRVSLASARGKLGRARELLEQEGRDPGAEQMQVRRADRDSMSVQDLADFYIEKWAKPRKRSWKEDQRQLTANVLPFIGRKKAKDVTKRDVIEILDSLIDRGSPIAANRTFAVIRKMFRFGLTKDIVPHNPCEALQAPSAEHQRDRVLNTDEIRAFWNTLDSDDLAMTPGIRLCLKLMLATAQRRVEVATVQWSDFDDDWWTVPAGVSKNALTHRVPLSPFACKLLRQADKGDSPFVFPGRSGNGPVRIETVTKSLRHNEQAFGLDHFTPHDLRRTAASQMASTGVSRLVISKLLNHVEGGVTAIYDRHSYDQEKRKALNAWGRKLESIVTGKKAKVIELKTG